MKAESLRDIERMRRRPQLATQFLKDLGLLTPEQARVHPYSNVITRCIGANAEVVPDLYFGHLRPGDVILLASDGLTGMLEDPHLATILGGEGGPQQWVDKLINEANRRGGLDNITAVVIRIEPDVPAEVTHPGVAAAQRPA